MKQTSSDDNGNFQIDGLNNRSECAQYKLIVDKYDDNPCTGNQPNRPSCGYPKAPGWQYAYTIDEGIRGGYWPLTTPTFGVDNYSDVVSQKKTEDLFIPTSRQRRGVFHGSLGKAMDHDDERNQRRI